MFSTYLFVAIGGAVGSVARFWFGAVMASLFGLQFPWGTILINILGSFLIGFIAVFTGPSGRLPIFFEMRAFLMVGLCGGFTTFSAFSLQTYELARESHWLAAGGNIALSVAVCLMAVWAGGALGGAISR